MFFINNQLFEFNRFNNLKKLYTKVKHFMQHLLKKNIKKLKKTDNKHFIEFFGLILFELI